jgi:hypothetical protein
MNGCALSNSLETIMLDISPLPFKLHRTPRCTAAPGKLLMAALLAGGLRLAPALPAAAATAPPDANPVTTEAPAPGAAQPADATPPDETPPPAPEKLPRDGDRKDGDRKDGDRKDGDRKDGDRKSGPSLAEELAQRKQRLKRMMSSFGVQDEGVQDAIIAHLQEEVEMRRQMREQVGHLQRLLRDRSTPDADIRQLTLEMRAAMEADSRRRREANERLDRQIGYSQNPRLEAMLLLFGVLGDNSMSVPFNPPPRRKSDADAARDKRRQQ